MKEYYYTVILVCMLFMTGCRQSEISSGINENITSQLQYDISDTTVFVSGMGCSDPSCTDPAHHHDCPPDCEDYDHHHNCDLDCTEISHHHRGTSAVNGLGQHHSEWHHGGNHH